MLQRRRDESFSKHDASLYLRKTASVRMQLNRKPASSISGFLAAPGRRALASQALLSQSSS